VRKTFKKLIAEYGVVAVVLYFAIFFLVFGGVWVALRAGWSPSSATGTASTLVAAYVITKLTQPLRIGATVVLTPLFARLYERIRRATRATPPPSASDQ
jgi:hypothetical protein